MFGHYSVTYQTRDGKRHVTTFLGLRDMVEGMIAEKLGKTLLKVIRVERAA